MEDSKSNFIGFRSKELSLKLREIEAVNPSMIGLRSAIIRLALEEKLARLENGEDSGLRLNLPAHSNSAAKGAEKGSPRGGASKLRKGNVK